MSNLFRFARVVPRLTPRLVQTPVFQPARLTPITLATRFYSAEKAPLTPQQVEDRVLQLLRDFDKVDASKLNLDAHFINDLGLDSLDQVEITMALEDEFNIEIPDRDAEEIMTPRQASEKIFANKNAM
ncbi:acyl carrier protein [Spizellomyces punctatus DAOM BR117]|uniref:Acyl carrier protein n=1 Tax=Spizellomyces punctatus (strain DAOM BR117) TaxID=645134 RepID=A0A0L0HT74_SPIPD|nr:acyl carrier protein [Spizellomyces punctatus DAOM BR117]KND04085.1 acyl carrier protein [Spizellomyces punctatus DAOM BR117]|eukprot:XP_016612124.1 acyl carrier protein [Spizellomyces punctatus DAOM BR117]